MEFVLPPDKPPEKGRRKLEIVLLVLLITISLFVTLMLQKPAEKAVVQTKPATVPAAPEPIIRAALITTGLQQPTAIASIRDHTDKRLFVLEKPGLIRIIDAKGTLDAAPFLDIRGKVFSTAGEMGLLGVAFHPDYKKNGFLYVNYIDLQQNTVIARYALTADKKAADPASEKVLLTFKQPYQNHNGGDLAFGPDGFLYISSGDGGAAADPLNRAQDRTNLFGKILRVDVNKGDPYAVPPTNPFTKEAGVKPEIWAYGLRNPWRISFDKRNGDLYIADVGQGEVEELNVQKADSKGGENYGWRCFEGNKPFNPAGCQNVEAYVKPVLEYDHQENRCSISGGYVYRGTRYLNLSGKYFYGDYCNGELYYTKQETQQVKDAWKPVLAAKTPYMISVFGQGSDGELYFADYKTGSIYHVQDAADD